MPKKTARLRRKVLNRAVPAQEKHGHVGRHLRGKLSNGGDVPVALKFVEQERRCGPCHSLYFASVSLVAREGTREVAGSSSIDRHPQINPPIKSLRAGRRHGNCDSKGRVSLDPERVFPPFILERSGPVARDGPCRLARNAAAGDQRDADGTVRESGRAHERQ